MAEYADIMQARTRNMQNLPPVKELVRSGRPVLLKPCSSATVNQLLLSDEYITLQGNTNIVLCERSIHTFEIANCDTSDLVVVPLLNELTQLPLIVDHSHATDNCSLLSSLARAAVAIGADRLMVEVHPCCETASVTEPAGLIKGSFVT